MKPINLFFALFLFIFYANSSAAQKFDDAFYRTNVLKTVYPIDSQADAIVLYEKGDIHINPNGSGYNQVYHLRRIIKILKNTHQALGNIKEAYPNDNRNDVFSRNVHGTTYNLEGDKVIATQLDNNAIYDKKIGTHHHEMAFAMPAVKEGSVIDYEFEVVTKLYIDLPHWEFQSIIPKLISEFEIVSPSLYKFSSVRHGKLPFKKYSSIKEAQDDKSAAYEVITPAAGERYSILWFRSNMTGLKPEPFISTVENFKEQLDMQIAGYANNEYVASWKQYDDDLRNNKYFGKQLTNANNFLDPVVDSLTKNDTTLLSKAHNIFNYVRSNFECSHFDAAFADHVISEVFESKKGTDAEINLLLTAMMRKAGIEAAPMQLSKLGHLRAVESYPFVDMFNYLVCYVKIDAGQYFLDATDKFNPFGTLPVYCYNGYAHIIDDNDSGIMLTSKNINDKDFYKVNISRVTDSSMNLEATERMGIINGVKLRNEIVKDSAFLKKHVEKRVADLQAEVKVINISVDNLYHPDKDLVIRYSLKINRPASAAITYFNSDLIRFFQKNPFTDAHRQLPMEFRNKCDYSYSLDMLLPAGLAPDDLPGSSQLKVDGDGLRFEHNISYDSTSGMLSVIARFIVNETNYPVSDYEQVQSFFDKMIEEQKKVFVLKETAKK